MVAVSSIPYNVLCLFILPKSFDSLQWKVNISAVIKYLKYMALRHYQRKCNNLLCNIVIEVTFSYFQISVLDQIEFKLIVQVMGLFLFVYLVNFV